MNDMVVTVSLEPRRQINNAIREFAFFTQKQIQSCIFAGSFFVLLAASKYLPLFGMPRYDFLLLSAIIL